MGSPRLATPQAPRGTLLVERRHLPPNLSEAPSRPSWLRLVSLAGTAGAAATALRHSGTGDDLSRVRTVPGERNLIGSRRVGGVRETRLRIQRHVDLQRQCSAGPAAPHLGVEYTGDKAGLLQASSSSSGSTASIRWAVSTVVTS